MSYEPYVTYEYYCDAYKGNVIPMDELDKALKQASRHIDSLTYNRIVGRGFSNLTAFQQETIQEVVCQQADWAQNLQFSGQRPLRPLIMEQSSAYWPQRAFRMASAPRRKASKSSVSRKETSSSCVNRFPFIISSAVCSAAPDLMAASPLQV